MLAVKYEENAYSRYIEHYYCLFIFPK